MKYIRGKIYKLLRISEKYAGTDMVYLAKGGSWLTINQIFATIAGIVLLVFFTNILSKEDYGLYRFVLSFVSLLSIFSLPGMGTAISQAIARGFDGALSDGLRTRMKWGALTFVVTLGVAIYYYTNENMTLAISFGVMALMLPLMKTFQLYQSVLLSKKEFRHYAVAEMTFKFVSVAVMIAALLLVDSILAIIVVYLVHMMVLRLAGLLWVKNVLKLNKEKDDQIFTFGKHMSVIKILQTIAGQFDKLLIFHYLGAAPLAVYALAIAPVDQIRGVLNNLKVLAFPKLSTKSIDEIKRTLGPKINKLTLAIVGIIIVYVLLAPFIFQILFPTYMDSVIYSQIYALVLIFMPKGFYSTVFSAQKKVKELYYIRIIGPIFRMALLWVLLLNFGLMGLIVGMVLSELLLTILYHYFYNRLT